MDILNDVKKKFEDIQNDSRLSNNQKAIEYARLMTTLEKEYNIPLTKGNEFEMLPKEIKKIYLNISKARN